MRVRILCKGMGEPNAEHPLAAISHFHWQEDFTGYEGEYTREEMVEFIKGGNEAYIKDPADPIHSARIYVTTAHTKNGTVYICTKIHGEETDHLLELVECKA